MSGEKREREREREKRKLGGGKGGGEGEVKVSQVDLWNGRSRRRAACWAMNVGG